MSTTTIKVCDLCAARLPSVDWMTLSITHNSPCDSWQLDFCPPCYKLIISSLPIFDEESPYMEYVLAQRGGK